MATYKGCYLNKTSLFAMLIVLYMGTNAAYTLIAHLKTQYFYLKYVHNPFKSYSMITQ